MSTLLWAGDEGGACLISLADTTRPVAPRYLPVPSTTCPRLPEHRGPECHVADAVRRPCGNERAVQVVTPAALLRVPAVVTDEVVEDEVEDVAGPGLGDRELLQHRAVGLGEPDRYGLLEDPERLGPAAGRLAGGREHEGGKQAGGQQATHARRRGCEAPHRAAASCVFNA